MNAHHERELQGSTERGFTLPEMLIVITLLGLIGTVMAVMFATSMRATRRVATVLPGAQATQNLNSWLKSDIESLSPTGLSTWIADSSSFATGTGCSTLSPVEPVGTVNVLHIETKDPTGRAVSPNDKYAASYRYRTDGTLWRVWCVIGKPSIVHNELVAGLKAKPIATYDATNNKIFITAITRSKAVDYSFSLVSAVRTASTTTLPIFATTTTKSPHDPCQYTAATVVGRNPLLAVVPISKNSPGNSPGFLGVGTAPYVPYTLAVDVEGFDRSLYGRDCSFARFRGPFILEASRCEDHDAGKNAENYDHNEELDEGETTLLFF
jgi:prepilin-type N-terminal cleavage/methylation domain-containing protein